MRSSLPPCPTSHRGSAITRAQRPYTLPTEEKKQEETSSERAHSVFGASVCRPPGCPCCSFCPYTPIQVPVPSPARRRYRASSARRPICVLSSRAKRATRPPVMLDCSTVRPCCMRPTHPLFNVFCSSLSCCFVPCRRPPAPPHALHACGPTWFGRPALRVHRPVFPYIFTPFKTLLFKSDHTSTPRCICEKKSRWAILN